MKILIIEEKVAEINLIKRLLRENGHITDTALSAAKGESFAFRYFYDLIILDLNLPDKDGLDLCKELCTGTNKSRILILTSRESIEDRVKAFDYGADDFIMKPFHSEELLARIRALSRREVTHKSPLISFGDINLNSATKEVKKDEQVIDLTNKEFSLLEYMMENPNILLTRRMIEEHIWDNTLDSCSNIIDTYVSRLRKKLNQFGLSVNINCVYGAGYRLTNNREQT